MSRRTFLTFASFVACTIGVIAAVFPMTLLVDMKSAVPGDTGLVMARTAGVFLLSFGVLNFLARGDADSPTMTNLLLANALLQVLILPVDPLAYAMGVYGSVMSFIPNTILHVGLLFGFLYYWNASISRRNEYAGIG
ncbi:hypothetical protein FMN63_28060 [Stappia sp. BW2]|uniref:hypothetical protein n=1 Tax=Stappia sp. BW2 TaxID=2592622 RepID=UPI0011DEFA06|nr:hypothetical protein [Stappia sp. BW2]TYC64085.1 hypothetical protein FMN63_28060 [Stappia sp. BW2]